MREYVCMYVGLRRGKWAAFRPKNWATAVLDGGRRRVRSGADELVRRATTATGVGRYLRAATVLPVDRWRTWYPGATHNTPPPSVPFTLFCCKDSGSSCNRPGGLTRRLGFPRIAAPGRPQIQRDGRSGHPRARVGATTVLYPESWTSIPVAECTVVWIYFFFTKST
jgi:hypothetical protein